MGAGPFPRLSVEEYLAIDRAAELKSEYHDGEMFPIASVSSEHARIVPNVIYCLVGPLRVALLQSSVLLFVYVLAQQSSSIRISP